MGCVSMRTCKQLGSICIEQLGFVMQDGGITDGEQTAVILCGQKEMAEALTAMVQEKGVKTEFILTNF